MVAQPLAAFLKAAAISGLIAGVAAAGFHFLLTEPVIDRAIHLEERLSQEQGAPAEEPVVSRRAQKAGLILGFLLYGGAWGLLFGVILHLAHGWFPPWAESRRGLALALVLGWSVALFPFLKYPANPPGVGDPETIGYRQLLFLSFLALSVIGTAIFLRLLSSLRLRKYWVWLVVGYLVYLTVAYALLPDNPDPVRLPADLVCKFRALSFAGLLLFWLVLGGAFAWVSEAKTHRR